MTKLTLDDLARALAEGLMKAGVPTVLGENGLLVSQSYNNVEIVDPAPIARAILTTIDQAGYRIVPVEATEHMLAAGFEDYPSIWTAAITPEDAKGIWQAMLNAAPQIKDTDLGQ